MPNRAGKKYTNNHETVTKEAAIVCDILHALPVVTKISPGIIVPGVRSPGDINVKIIKDENHLLLRVVGGRARQDLHIYVKELNEGMTIVEQSLLGKRNKHLINVTLQ